MRSILCSHRRVSVRERTRTANTLHKLANLFEARLRDANVVAEENKYFARFDAEKTITLSGTVKEFQWSAPEPGLF
jgi:hypothetical protein